ARNAALVQELADGLRGRDVVVAGDPDNAGSGFTGGRTGEGRTDRPTAVLPARRRGRHSLARARRGSLPCSVPSCGEDAEDVTVTAPAPAPQPSTEPAVPDDADAAMARMDMSARQMFESTDVGLAVRLRDYMRSQGGRPLRTRTRLPRLGWPDVGGRRRHYPRSAAPHGRGDDRGRAGLRAPASSEGSDEPTHRRHSEGAAQRPGAPAKAEQFDASPDRLSVAKGTINLRTRKIHPHDPADVITRRLDTAYRPDAPADRWTKFLTEVFSVRPPSRHFPLSSRS
ncbi:MAG: Phage/plasmid primase, family, C-terminal domain, partial [Streptosporangiaceae bacterium]|nr:Phage/plasmid primase, family, C-terminal domain [Streptosporangiaceae bacterium]